MARLITPDDAVGAALDAMAGPFGWKGAADCGATACAAFQALTGVDLMRGLRGRYVDRRGAMAIIRAAGGFVALWHGQARGAGISPGPECCGSIGIIRPQNARVLGLCVEPGLWAAKAMRGAMFCEVDSEVCWNA